MTRNIYMEGGIRIRKRKRMGMGRGNWKIEREREIERNLCRIIFYIKWGVEIFEE